ncbi:hypothetical protein GGD38_004136 [Chitinophagaceae bacterium OAS944]|nr:hypothetical protein [Chitinophagaceae bacterium OAS944]
MSFLYSNMIMLFLLFHSFAAFSQKNNKINRRSARLFKYHLNILDSAAKRYTSNTVPCCSSSIAFLVEHSNVKVLADGTFHGYLFFTKSELSQWHKWYDEKIAKR